jgi:trigger factor
MHVQIEDLSPVEKKLAVEIPWERVREKLDRAYRALGTQVVMNGFRKGKVPRAVLEQRYGRHVQQEVAKELVQESFIAAAEEHKIDAVAEPHIDDINMKLGEAFRYSARIEVRAPIELKEWEGLAASRARVVVPDDDVERALERKRQEHTEYRPISERKELAASDAVMLSLKGTVGETPLERDLTVDLGDDRREPLPGLHQALIGLPTDAKEHEVVLELPESAEHAEISGKTARLKVTVRDAREKVVPALDDEFAKDTGEADTLDELRGKLRGQLEKVAASRADRDMKEGLIKTLVAKNPTPVAPALVERGIDSQIERARLSFAMQGVDLAKTGIDLKGMRERLRDGAADEIRGQLLLEAIADQEKIEIRDADVEAKIAELAAAQGKRPAKVKADMEKEGSLSTLRWRLRQEKALDLVASRATITEVDPPAPGSATESGGEGDAAEVGQETPQP